MFDKWKENGQGNPTTQSIVAQLGYPYQFFSTESTYEEVMDAYEKAVLEGQREGYTPVLVPADTVVAEEFGILRDGGSVLEDNLKTELDCGEVGLR